MIYEFAKVISRVCAISTLVSRWWAWTPRKGLVGAFKNGGRERQPAEQPVPVNVHDFVDRVLGKAIPYGVYDLASNTVVLPSVGGRPDGDQAS